jgi:hypothetical protein
MTNPPLEPLPEDGPVDPNPSYPDLPPGQFGPPFAPAPPPLGHPGRYPPPWDSGRPSGLITASVLGYIDAGLLILAGLLLLVGASEVDSWSSAFGTNDTGVTAELAADGILNLISAGLLIGGGVMMAARTERGRILFTVGAALCIVLGMYWLVRLHSAVVVWTAVFVGLPVVGLSLAWTMPSTAWLRGQDPRKLGPPRPFGT